MSDSEREKGDDAAVADTLTSGEHPRLSVESGKHESPLVIESDRYQLLSLLGRGGMGEVHKAFDPRVGRFVALKVMREASPEQAGRLVSEARAQARVDHPHVCRVYGVGELANGLPFIALQFIEGKTLSQVAKEMTREERIAVIRDVAEALHAAHRQGLVHRDMKPSNVLVEKHETGWHAYVTDFGIARQVDTPGMTKTGVVSGTPLYMAPEQARGQTAQIDRRTDVYGLGATLYELLCGRRPFEADTTLVVMWKLLNEEPAAPRSIDPSIPVDLETIVMKCLEKEPSRRYDSARALADDLKAWADGEPIHARRSSLGYRLVKRARKHKALVALAAFTLVGAVGTGATMLRAKRLADEQARLAHAFGQEVERNDAAARYAALLPLHDTRRERATIEARMRELEGRIAQLGGVAEGPGRYALGRGYLVLGRPAEARRELERAWKVGYRAPEVSYALGLALGQLYQRALSSLPPSNDDKSVEAERRRELAQKLREPALAYLKQAQGLQSEAPEYVEGLIALHERRWQDALDKARAAEVRVPWMYEAHTLEGDIHSTLASERWVEGGPDEALAELERAGRAYETAASIARSSVPALVGNCRRWLMAAVISLNHDRQPHDAVQGAVEACERATQAEPDDGEAYADEIDAWRQLAVYELRHNGDPRPAWSEAERVGVAAQKLVPNDARLAVANGYVARERASWMADHGEDPHAENERAITSAKAALAVDANWSDAYHLASDAWLQRGDWEAAHGGDPRASYAMAADMGQRAWTLSPEGFLTLNAIGLAYLSIGMWEATNGLDPRTSLGQAATWTQRVIKANPNVDYGYNNLCVTWETLGEWQLKRRLDPMATFERAMPPCKSGIEKDPNAAATQHSLGELQLDIAAWQRLRGTDPTAQLEQARATFRRALALDAQFVLAHSWLGETELVAARWAADRGRDPTASFDAARAHYERALAINASDADSLRGLAEMHRWRAEWNAAHGRPVDGEVKAGLERAQAALKVNARHATAALQSGALHLVTARAAGGDERKREAAAAKTDLERALKLDANLEADARPLVEEAAKLAK